MIKSKAQSVAVLTCLFLTACAAKVMALNSFVARSLRGRWARWQEKWSQHDGLFTKRPSVLKILEPQRLSARPYSVSALQNFAVCPYRFLLSAIYRLEPHEELAPLEEMDPLTKGALFHRIQAEMQRQLKDKGLLPVKTGQLSQSLQILDRVIKRVAEEAYEELAPAIERVWLDSIEAMRADLRTWLEKVAEQDGWTPIHFEFGFGFKTSAGRDPASLPDPVKLATGELVHGVVDMIESSDDRRVLFWQPENRSHPQHLPNSYTAQPRRYHVVYARHQLVADRHPPALQGYK